ncbi:MAG: VWA domain-containing protein [Planctomycetota bacterium]
MIQSNRPTSTPHRSLGAVLLATAILWAGCGGGPDTTWDLPPDYGNAVNPDGQIVILVIDRSLSMTQKDPNNFNIAGAQIALSVMDDEDNAGVVTFAGEGDFVQTTRPLESAQGRIEFRDKLESIKITGRRTDFSMGLGAAKALIEPLKGKGKAISVVFLTDGEHSVRDTADDIPPLIEEFAENEWKIFAIDLAARTAKTELLRDMAAKTRGAYFKIENPEDLPRAFIEIFSDIKDFWRYGSRGAVRVQPLMKKLIYLLIRGHQGGYFRGIHLDGKTIPLDAENLYHYPDVRRGKRRYWFEIASISSPTPGAYSYTTAKKPKVWTLATFPVSLTLLEEAPKKQYREDEAVEFGIQARCQSQEVADMVRKAALVSVRLTSAASGDQGAPVVLSLVKPQEGADPLTLVFRGATFIRLAEKGVPEDFTARIRFAIRDEQQGRWFAGKLATFRVEPGLPKVLMVEPSQALIGSKWVDQGVLSMTLATSTEVESGSVQLTASTEAVGVTVDPTSVTLRPGSPVSLTVSVDPEKKLPPGGDFQDIVLLKAVAPDGRTLEMRVPVIFGIYRFEGPETIQPRTAPPGFQISHTFEFTIAPEVTPVEVYCENITGPGGEVQVMIRSDVSEAPEEGEGEGGGGEGESGSDEEPGEDAGEGTTEGEGEAPTKEESLPPPKSVLVRVRLDIPTDGSLAEGRYTGTIIVTGPGEPPLTREIPLEVEMTVPVPEVKIEPEKIVLEPDREGWVETEIELSLVTSFPSDLSIVAEDLFPGEGSAGTGVVSKAYDIRLVPEEGWRGDRLESGRTHKFRYRVYVSPNLLPGSYQGGILMEVAGRRKNAKVRLPVELKVK